MHLYFTYISEGNYVKYRWAGKPYQSRLCFQFEPDGEFEVAKSYDEDVRPLLKSGKEEKK